jgi:cell division protein FtsI (penicillin-binding protein 3)
LLFAAAVVIQLYRVQFIQGDKWKAMAKAMSTKYENIEASRGNIYSVDGSLLATSVPEYELRMDMIAGGIAKDKVFYEKVDSLAESLSQLYPDRSAKEFSRMLREARKDGDRYQLIRRRVTHSELKKIRKFPIFKLGKYKGGLIVLQQNKRILPFKSLAARTIGYKNENVKNPVGLEGAYADYINGETGKRLMQRIAGGVYIPVNNGEEEIPAKDGADIISTIDVNYQDVAQDALKKQLIKSKADHGSVVLMEVATGEIRAIANFTRTKEGEYKEKFNYAINDAAEPGSTFKLASYMAAIDDGKIDTGTLLDARHGRYDVINPRNGKIALKIRDAEDEGGVMSARRAFEKSSNVAVSTMIASKYRDNPQAFIDKLYSYHLNEKNVLQISGEGKPRVKNTKSEDWNKLQSLYQIAYGYESKLTPLQMLTFYNSIANGGKLIAPVFVREIKRLGNTVERFQARVINPQICSPATLAKMRGMLEGVVLEGTGKLVIKNDLYSVAGKTGTAQIAQGSKGYGAKNSHQASFCGYFPADKPKYSMIVVISDPKGQYLAAWVAGPVFREIADRVYSNDFRINQKPQTYLVGNTNPPKVKQGNAKALKQVYTMLGIKPLYANAATTVDTSNGVSYSDVQFKSGSVPTVTGMGLSDALYAMGNAGYKVKVRGSGVVKNQSVTGGSMIPKGSRIELILE